MKVLIACEFSGVVRRAFRACGHDTWSCDLVSSDDRAAEHIELRAEEVIKWGCWDLMLAFPPCTYLSRSGLWRNSKDPSRQAKTDAALDFVKLLLNAPIPRIALENPYGRISTAIRKPDQVIHPYQFGHDASKATCLWLKNLPLLQPYEPQFWVQPRHVNGKMRWANQTDSGQNRLAPSATRARDRAVTYRGIAVAMAQQWGGV